MTEIGLIEIPASSWIFAFGSFPRIQRISSSVSGLPFSNSMPAYRSSVFSRIMIRSTC